MRNNFIEILSYCDYTDVCINRRDFMLFLNDRNYHHIIDLFTEYEKLKNGLVGTIIGIRVWCHPHTSLGNIRFGNNITEELSKDFSNWTIEVPFEYIENYKRYINIKSFT